jgi:hypothetical protein
MCTRWQQIGAFYPFSRNHNADSSPDQDPAAYSQQSIDSTRRALLIRYTILPYYYTLFHKAHINGTMVVKGLFQEFPKDKNCRTIDRQFLVGPAVLVTPVLEPSKTSVTGIFFSLIIIIIIILCFILPKDTSRPRPSGTATTTAPQRPAKPLSTRPSTSSTCTCEAAT